MKSSRNEEKQRIDTLNFRWTTDVQTLHLTVDILSVGMYQMDSTRMGINIIAIQFVGGTNKQVVLVQGRARDGIILKLVIMKDIHDLKVSKQSDGCRSNLSNEILKEEIHEPRNSDRCFQHRLYNHCIGSHSQFCWPKKWMGCYQRFVDQHCVLPCHSDWTDRAECKCGTNSNRGREECLRNKEKETKHTKIDRIGFERRGREGRINKHIESSTTSNTTDMTALQRCIGNNDAYRSVTSNRNQFIRNNLLLI